MNDKVQPILLGNPNHRQNNVGYIQVHGTDSSSSRSSSPDNLPAYLIPGRLISFFKPSLDAVESISVFASKDRNEKYTTIIIAKSENGANQLFEDFNGVRFSSFDQSCCFMHRVERFGVSANSWDDSNAQQFINLFTSCGENSDSLKVSGDEVFCPVCLEDVNTSSSQHFTTGCGHIFHIDCISQIEGPCPVCRFHHETLRESQSCCSVCFWQGNNSSELALATSSEITADDDTDLWVCLVCGFTGCGQYHQSHIKEHYEESLHTYAMNVGSRRVWDFSGEGFVHRLILNSPQNDNEEGSASANGSGNPKLVETSNLISSDFRKQNIPLSSSQEEALINTKLESTFLAYNEVLARCMEQTRIVYEARLKRIRESSQLDSQETSSSNSKSWVESLMTSLSGERNKLLRQLKAAKERLQRSQKELDILLELNVNLKSNLAQWESRVKEAELRVEETKKTARSSLPILEAKVAALMGQLDGNNF